MFRRLACWAALLALLAGMAQAQPADTVLLDGKIVTFDGAPAEALAVRGDRIVAVGRSVDVARSPGPRHG
jgi:predicted amidohydrolase YtcJ